MFNVVEGKGLTKELLPHLIPEEESKGDSDRPLPTVVDLMNRFLRYPYRARLPFADALAHPWFTKASTILIPPGYKSALEGHWDVVLASSSEVDEPPRSEVEKVWKPTLEEKVVAKEKMETQMVEVWNGKTLTDWFAVILGTPETPASS